MVTLHVLKLLEDNGFGTIDTDLFWEEAPLNANGDPAKGVWIVSRAAPLSRVNVTTQPFDIYARFGNKLETHSILENILHFLQDQYGETCELPTVTPYSETLYTNVRLTPTSGIERTGTDQQDMIVMSISGQVQYDAIFDSE